MNEEIKRAIDIEFPVWRQIGISGSSDPSLIIVEIGDSTHIIAACDGVRVFGAGHLTAEHWWGEGGIGACLKCPTDALDAIGTPRILGYLHLHRSGGFTPGMRTGVEAEALDFLAAHQDEYSVFIPVEFVREGSETYPWRARRRR